MKRNLYCCILVAFAALGRPSAAGGGGNGSAQATLNSQRAALDAQCAQVLLRVQMALGMHDGEDWSALSSKIETVLLDYQKLALPQLVQVISFNEPLVYAPTIPVNYDFPLAVALDDLARTVASAEVSDEVLKIKLKTVYDYRAIGQRMLKADQRILQKAVSVQQEAILVKMGVLD